MKYLMTTYSLIKPEDFEDVYVDKANIEYDSLQQLQTRPINEQVNDRRGSNTPAEFQQSPNSIRKQEQLKALSN